jgi:hypothetical protein
MLELHAGDHKTVWCRSPAVPEPCDAATEGETMPFGLFGSAAADIAQSLFCRALGCFVPLPTLRILHHK